MYDPTDYGLDTQDVPTWMRPRLRGTDWTLLATLALCLAVAWPLIVRNGIPHSPEAEPQMYRILAMSESLQSGNLYPRWTAKFNYGYGSPIFNHIAPLPYYLGGVYVTLTRDGPHVSLKVMMIGAIFVAGVSMMSFVRRRWGDFAGLFAAILLLFSPYVALIGSHLQFDLGSMWAMALFVATLWMLDRALIDGRGRNCILLMLTSGALLVADTTLSPLFFVIATIWALWVIVFNFRAIHWKLGLAGLLAGLGLSTFYRLPAMVEKNTVRWQGTSTYPIAIDLSKLFQPLEPLDQSAFNPIPTPQLGIATWLLAITGGIWLLGMVGVAWRHRRQSKNMHPIGSTQPQISAAIIFIPIIVLIGVAMLSPDSQLWGAKDNFEAIRPEDLLSILTVCCVIVAVQTIVMIETLLRNMIRRIAAISIIVAIGLFSAANGLYTPDFTPIQGAVSSTQNFNKEVRGHALGTFRNGYFLPKDVQELPRLTNVPFNADNPDQIDIVEPQNLPPNAGLEIISQSETSHDLLIESRGESNVTILAFYYEGWQAIRDGQQVAIGSTHPEGLINIPLEEGENDLSLQFKDTPIRRNSWFISGGVLVSTLLFGLWFERRQAPNVPATINPLIAAKRRERQVLGIVTSAVFVGLCIAVRLQPSLVSIQTAEGNVPPNATVFGRIIQGGISLLGYDFISPTTLANGESLLLTVFWHANSPNLPGDYQIDLFLAQADNNEQITYHTQYRHIADVPTKEWLPQGYIVGQYMIEIPDDMPTGAYQVVLQVGSCDRIDLIPCNNPDPHDVYTLQGPTGKQVILPTVIRIE